MQKRKRVKGTKGVPRKRLFASPRFGKKTLSSFLLSGIRSEEVPQAVSKGRKQNCFEVQVDSSYMS